MASTSQQYCLRWNNHRSNLLTVFDELLQNEAFTDVTLAVEGGASVKCHKMVLAACSSYFQTLFIDLPCKHPIVVLKDVKYSEIKAILEYMYRGEVNVAQEQLAGLLKVAEVLKVKGLVEENGPQCRREEVETSMSPPPAISTSTTSSAAQSSGHASPPHSTGTSYNIYGKSPVDRSSRLPLPMWPLSGFPISHSSSSQQAAPPSQHSSILAGSYDNGYETSPLKRKKFSNMFINRDTPILRTVLGQGHADSSQGIPLLNSDSHENFRTNSNGSSNDNDRRSSIDLVHGEPAHSPYTDVSMMDDDDKQSSPQSYPADIKPGIANYVPTQKPEWKRYKQYTRNDIMSAIEAVRSGMSALQAARKYGVPSRTLYDKVKKLGITTSRPFKRGSNGSGACFPYGIGGNANGNIYGGALSENENDGSVIEGPESTLETYKSRDTPMDREMLDTTRCTSNPIVHSVKQQSSEDQVEDLSMYCRAQICIYYLLWTATLSLKLTLEQETTTAKNWDCPAECICLSPKQALCNTGGLKDIPTQQLPQTVEELSLTKNNFPIIKGDAFAGLKVLKKLTMDGNNISTIRPFAFRGLSKLRELSIQHTPLPFIEKFSFAALQNVSVLLLANNKIRYIEAYSFAGTSNIRVILLTNNPLLRIHSHAFSGLTNVVRLIFPSGIRTIKPDAFDGLQHVGLLKLTYMDLSSLQSYTFRGLSYVHSLNIQESDLGIIERAAFAGLSHVDRLNILNNKIDLIEKLFLRYENNIEMLRFHGNHVLQAPRHAKDIKLEVNSISAIDNHFPCDCQAHNVLESDFVNGTISDFQKRNFCISPIEYNGKPMNLVDFDLVARCYDNVVQDNLGSGVIGVFTLPTTLFLILLFSMNLFQ
ncbi:Protein tramtrack, beta isoform [Anthophora retusa]